MSLSTHITERLKITSKSKSASIRTIKPETKFDLQLAIRVELRKQGPDADLNHIDVSEIEDMVGLFENCKIRNIKIDEWDVSNVTNMAGMFPRCKEFSCDLSSWDVSNVTNNEDIFVGCRQMYDNPQLQPKFN